MIEKKKKMKKKNLCFASTKYPKIENMLLIHDMKKLLHTYTVHPLQTLHLTISARVKNTTYIAPKCYIGPHDFLKEQSEVMDL